MMPNTEQVKLELIQLYTYSAFDELSCRVYAAVPTEVKPVRISPKTWATRILCTASQYENFRFAIPRSFWNKKWGEIPVKTKNSIEEYIDIIDDMYVSGGYESQTPLMLFRDIIETLKNGVNVLIPSASLKISGFVPSLLMLSTHDAHPAKICDPNLTLGYGFTPFLLGYVYGICDGRAELDYIREGLEHYRDISNSKIPCSVKSEYGYDKVRDQIIQLITQKASTADSSKFTPSARMRWDQITQLDKEYFLSNVWCAECRHTTVMQPKNGKMTSDCLVMHGVCSMCGGTVARVIEPVVN